MKFSYWLGGTVLMVLGIGFLLTTQTKPTTQAPATTPNVTTTPMSLSLTSSVFGNNEFIPALYTCDGENTPPPLNISGVPTEAKTLVLVMDDPDIPQAIKDSRAIEKFDHWVVFNIPANSPTISANTGEPGQNSTGNTGYTGPCPPAEFEPTTHRYIFRLYALPESLAFSHTPTLDEVEAATKAKAIATAELVGRYDRTK